VKYYAGIGSRQTPLEFKALIKEISFFLEKEQYVLNSGGADGADSFFEEGIKNKQIFLPSQYWNDNPSMLYHISPDAYSIAKKFHPNWHGISGFAKKLMGRNSYQVLNRDLNSPVDFIVCWTENGEVKGGTAQALRIAAFYDIPVCNLFFYDSFDKFLDFYEIFKADQKH